MAETDLTKEIKKRLRYFRPEMNITNRVIRYAYEVLTPSGGFVDVVRFEDYVSEDKSFCRMITPQSGESNGSWQTLAERNGYKCKLGSNYTFPNPRCHGCIYRCIVKELSMLTTCYEVKISKADFKSENGHNFCGERNYYAMPKALYPQIKVEIPPGIGAITFDADTGIMRIARHCEHRKITEEDKVFLLYNALKKWCGWNQLYAEGIL